MTDVDAVGGDEASLFLANGLSQSGVSYHFSP